MRVASLFICRFDRVSTKTPAGFLADMDKLMLKFMQKCEALGMFKTILKKENKAGRSALPDFKTYYKVTVLETAVQTYGWKCRSMGGQGGTRNKASPMVSGSAARMPGQFNGEKSNLQQMVPDS